MKSSKKVLVEGQILNSQEAAEIISNYGIWENVISFDGAFCPVEDVEFESGDRFVVETHPQSGIYLRLLSEESRVSFVIDRLSYDYCLDTLKAVAVEAV